MASTPALSVWVWQDTPAGCNQLCHSYQLFWYLWPDSSCQDLQDWLHRGLAVYRTGCLQDFTCFLGQYGKLHLQSVINYAIATSSFGTCAGSWYPRPDSSCQDLQDWLHIGLAVYRTAALDNMANYTCRV